MRIGSWRLGVKAIVKHAGDAAFLAGLAMVVAGAWMIYVPAALILAGLSVAALAYLLGSRHN